MEGADHGLPTWVTGGIVTIIASMAAFGVGMIKFYLVKEAKQAEEIQEAHGKAIIVLQNENAEIKILAEECVKDRANQSVRIAVLEERARIQDDNETNI